MLVILTMICAGCLRGPASDSVLAPALRKPIDRLAVSLAGADVAAMRRDGRNVIATYDAAVGPR